MTFVGIDPGAKGAIASIVPENIFVHTFDPIIYIQMLEKIKPEEAIICLEHVHAMPKQGVTSMFNFGRNFGWIQGVIEAFKIPYELVTPQKWKKTFSISDKNDAIKVCQRLFPNVDLRKTLRCKKNDDGIAEALLMAEYARRVLAR